MKKKNKNDIIDELIEKIKNKKVFQIYTYILISKLIPLTKFLFLRF